MGKLAWFAKSKFILKLSILEISDNMCGKIISVWSAFPRCG